MRSEYGINSFTENRRCSQNQSEIAESYETHHSQPMMGTDTRNSDFISFSGTADWSAFKHGGTNPMRRKVVHSYELPTESFERALEETRERYWKKPKREVVMPGAPWPRPQRPPPGPDLIAGHTPHSQPSVSDSSRSGRSSKGVSQATSSVVSGSLRYQSMKAARSWDAHSLGVSRLALHPTKNIIASVSDDTTWKLWTAGDGELVMTGEGHSGWLSDASFHPTGNYLATAGGGDACFKVWDFKGGRCVWTENSGHSQCVWSVDFHRNTGDFLITASLDHSIKCWDFRVQRLRQTYRGHVDSANLARFQPFTSNVASASADKTISFWDLRTALCIHTLYGHTNAINHFSFDRSGVQLASCDADGLIHLWDLRMLNAPKYSASTADSTAALCCVIGQSKDGNSSEQRLLVGCQNGSIQVFQPEQPTAGDSGEPHNGPLTTVKAHSKPVNDLQISSQDSSTIYSCSDDHTVKVWAVPSGKGRTK